MCERMAPHHRPCTVGGRGGGRRVRAAGSCSQHLCPPGPVDCPVRRTKGGCCEHSMAAVEKGLVCQRRRHRAESEPPCVCQDKGSVCGSDGWTYPNICRLREPGTVGVILSIRCSSPYPSWPQKPVSSYPLPNLNWRKTGTSYHLSRCNPVIFHTRGGPQRYTVTTWLQIQGPRLSVAGVYSCISHNALGETSASKQLTVSEFERYANYPPSHHQINFQLFYLPSFLFISLLPLIPTLSLPFQCHQLSLATPSLPLIRCSS
uniref:Ig-like domain-containing protein n=1 Tax=Scophthalmus maximus TaxID=52904 RepID=A0A8D3A8W4_SCOMX